MIFATIVNIKKHNNDMNNIKHAFKLYKKQKHLKPGNKHSNTLCIIYKDYNS